MHVAFGALLILVGFTHDRASAEPSVAVQVVLQDSAEPSVEPSVDDADWHELDSQIQPALDRGELSEAIAAARAALEFAEQTLGSMNGRTVLSVDKLRYLLDHAGKFQEAEALHHRALQSREQVLGPKAPETLTERNNFGAWYLARGRFEPAELLLVNALEGRSEVLGEAAVDTMMSMNNLAALYTKAGRFAEAEPLLLRVVQLQDQHGSLSDNDYILSLSNLAVVYRDQQRPDEAKRLLETVYAWSAKALGPRHPDTLSAANNLGALYDSLSLDRRAEPLLADAFAQRREAFGDHAPATLELANNLAGLYRRQRRFSEALALLAQVEAGRTAALGAEHPLTYAALNNLGATYFDAGSPGEAEPLLARALAGLQKALGPEHPDTVEAAANLAVLHLSGGSETAALEPARVVAHGLSARRQTSLDDRYSETGRDRERQHFASYYTLLANAAWGARTADVDPVMSESLVEEAFSALQEAAFERTSKAVARMAVESADEDGEALSLLVRRRGELDRRWRAIQGAVAASLQLGLENERSEREPLAREGKALEKEIAEIDAQIEALFPRYFELVNPRPLTLLEAQALLGPSEAFLFIVPTNLGTHIFSVTKSEVVWKRSQLAINEVNHAVRRLRWDVGAKVDASDAETEAWLKEGEGVYPFDRRTAWTLYRELIEPVEESLRGYDELFVATGGALSVLPLGLLVTSEPVGADGDPAALRRTGWFADSHALTQLPSIQSLAFLRRFVRANPSEGGFLGFGDPMLAGPSVPRDATRLGNPRSMDAAGNSTAAGAASDMADRIRRFTRLPGTALELQDLSRAFGHDRSEVVLAVEATEEALRNWDLASVSVLAFATHGVMAGDLGPRSEPGLVLTPSGNTSDNDGLLTASEITQLKLHADLVILSACDTGAGDVVDGGEGLAGLARAFFYAGSRNLLASHWPVRDDVAPKLTVTMMELMQSGSGMSAAKSLQQAMKAIRDETSLDSAEDTWAHPSAWAPFILAGDGAASRHFRSGGYSE